jgi:hypothetical protein
MTPPLLMLLSLMVLTTVEYVKLIPPQYLNLLAGLQD